MSTSKENTFKLKTEKYRQVNFTSVFYQFLNEGEINAEKKIELILAN